MVRTHQRSLETPEKHSKAILIGMSVMFWRIETYLCLTMLRLLRWLVHCKGCNQILDQLVLASRRRGWTKPALARGALQSCPRWIRSLVLLAGSVERQGFFKRFQVASSGKLGQSESTVSLTPSTICFPTLDRSNTPPRKVTPCRENGFT